MSLRTTLLALAVVPALLAGACSESDAAGSGKLRGKLSGTGASFPAPLYQAWFKRYNEKVNSGVQVNYATMGSSKGVNAVIQGTHDFGASDAAMKDDEIARLEAAQPGRGVLMLPMTAGAVVVAYNSDVEGLKLSRDALAGIFLGKITKWNDPAIAAANGGVTLPNQDISVIVRSDGSGTTYAFTNHLVAASPEWKAQHESASKTVAWPEGFRSASKNAGVTQGIQSTPGSIGYVEYSYAVSGELKTAALENKNGKFVEPSIESFQAALEGAPMPENMRLFVPDPAGDASFPIVTYTWILPYKSYEDENKVELLKAVLDWCLTEGQQYSEAEGYVPLPATITDQVRASLKSIEVKKG